MRLRVLAPAKVNLGLFLGPVRRDGRHELVTLFESLSLADELTLTVRPAPPDEVHAPGVRGPNLVLATLEALRAAGWTAPPVRVEIAKRIPVAGGLGGGSADAAAALRLAHALEPLREGLAVDVAARLGADVPSQLDPGVWLGTGAGENLHPVDRPPPHSFAIVPQPFGLSTADVYREADRLGLSRTAEDLARCRRELENGPIDPRLMVNDLEPAACSLAPEVGVALDAVRRAGAEQALLCGSGPTVAGVWWGEEAEAAARVAADQLSARFPGATMAQPVFSAAPSRPCGTMQAGP